MSISRAFLLAGGLYLLIGIGFGMYMGGAGEFSFAPLHAHINLVGFVLMTLFGILYAYFPAMGASSLARVHFWLHLVGSLAMLVMLFLLLSGRIDEAQMVPVAPLAEGAIMLGVLAYLANLVRSGR